MTIMLDLPPAMEKQIEESIAQRDSQRLQRLLMDAIPFTVDQLINHPGRKLTAEQFQKFIHRFTESIDAKLEGKTPWLSDYAISREGIYEDHP